MKKHISLFLALLMLVSLFTLTSCGDGDKSGDAGNASVEIPEVGYDGSEVTVKFYHTMGQNLRDVLEIYIAEFNALYPKIKIEHEQVGGYDDVKSQISTQINVGNQPNIAYCYPDHVALYNLAKAVATLDGFIDSKIEITRADGTKEILGLTDEQKSDFIEGYYKEGAAFGDGLMYSLPLSKSTEVLYYNKTFFEQNGLSVPKTWEEMETVCAKILELDPNSIPLGYDSEANWFITMCEQYGSQYTSATGEKYLFNNDKNIEFVTKFREWYQNGYVTTQNLYGAYTSGLFTAATGQRCYMCIGSSAGAAHQIPDKDADGNYPFEVGIATIPQVNASNPKVISQGPSLCIFKKDNAQEVVASWLFVKFLTTKVEFQAEFSMVSGYVPVIKSVSTNAAYQKFIGDANGHGNLPALSAKICLEQEKAYYTSPAFNGSSIARDEVGLLMSTCLSGDDGGNTESFIKNAFKKAVDECIYKG